MAAAGRAALAERGLLRLVERLEDGKFPAEKSSRGRLLHELRDLSGVWPALSAAPPKSQDLVQRLGRGIERLGDRVFSLAAVTAFTPLGEDVKLRLLHATATLNAWVAENLPLGDSNGSSEVLVSLGEELKKLEEVPYVQSCYRRAADADVRVRFLVALGLVLRLPTEAGPVRSLAQKLTNSFFCLREGQDNVLDQWLNGRLARYDRIWRQVAAKAGSDELRWRLGMAIEKAGTPWLHLSTWPMATCPLARALCAFVEDHEQLLQCPEYTLRPGALLQILHDLGEPFCVDAALSAEGGISLTEAWPELKAREGAKPRKEKAAKAAPPAPRPAPSLQELWEGHTAAPKPAALQAINPPPKPVLRRASRSRSGSPKAKKLKSEEAKIEAEKRSVAFSKGVPAAPVRSAPPPPAPGAPYYYMPWPGMPPGGPPPPHMPPMGMMPPHYMMQMSSMPQMGGSDGKKKKDKKEEKSKKHKAKDKSSDSDSSTHDRKKKKKKDKKEKRGR